MKKPSRGCTHLGFSRTDISGVDRRLPSKRSSGEYRLRRKEHAKDVRFNFLRKTEVERSEIMQGSEVGQVIKMALAGRRVCGRSFIKQLLSFLPANAGRIQAVLNQSFSRHFIYESFYRKKN